MIGGLQRIWSVEHHQMCLVQNGMSQSFMKIDGRLQHDSSWLAMTHLCGCSGVWRADGHSERITFICCCGAAAACHGGRPQRVCARGALGDRPHSHAPTGPGEGTPSDAWTNRSCCNVPEHVGCVANPQSMSAATKMKLLLVWF